MTSRTRRPRSVYAVGTDPDPRFSFANERTFLAWIRTALGLLAAAIAVDVLEVDLTAAQRSVLGSALCLVAACAAVLAWRGWRRAERAMRLGESLPAPAVLPLLLGFAGIVGLTVVLVLGR